MIEISCFFACFHLMNAIASCCAFLKVRLMFALNRFVYSVENKSGNSEFFHHVFTVCMCVYAHLCAHTHID